MKTNLPVPRHQPGRRAGAVGRRAAAGTRPVSGGPGRQGMGGLLAVRRAVRLWRRADLAGHVQVDGQAHDGRAGHRPAGQRHRTVAGQTVRAQAEQAGIGMPEVGIFDSPQPNAFATGARRDAALVAVSTGLLRAMQQAAKSRPCWP